jgi:hypothetical protein
VRRLKISVPIEAKGRDFRIRSVRVDDDVWEVTLVWSVAKFLQGNAEGVGCIRTR